MAPQAAQSDKRVKMQVEVTVLAAKVTVSAYQELFVEWSRNNQSIKTKKLSVDENNGKVVFQKQKFIINASFYQRSDNSWKPDPNCLRLVCGGDTVGICDFDLSSFIGKFPSKAQKAVMQQKHGGSHSSNHVLLGDS